MELSTITNVSRLIFHLEDMIDVDIFSIRFVVGIIQELFQVKEVFMEHLNKFNILACIKNSTSLLKSKDFFITLQYLKAVKCVVIVVLCGSLYI